MAARTSSSFGVGAAITILSLAALGFFVAFAVFYGKYTDQKTKLQAAQADQADIVRADERNRDDIRNLTEDAKRERKSLVQYLVENQETLMQATTGARRDRMTDFAAKRTAIPGADATSLMGLIQARDAEITSLRQQSAAADAARQQAIADQQAEVARVQGIEDSHKEALDAASAQVKQLADENERLRGGTDDYKKALDAQLDALRNAAAETENRLQADLQKATEQNLILQNQLNTLRGTRNQGLVKAGDESALVDGEIIAVSGGNQAFITLGRANNVVLGMTFSVYSTANAIRPDADGNYPRPKATLEVISVGDNSSTCRITSEVRGNPVVKGDVIANPVYDPNKKYKFVIFGNFDADRDGLATPMERGEVQALIQSWGGVVVNDLSGDADFLVLGERPVTPARPGSGAPLEVVLEYQRKDTEAQRYDQLYRQGVSTSIPILNENRLYTLMGKTPSPQARR